MRTSWNNWRYFLVTGFFLGLAPVMPGTFGTLGGVFIHLAVIYTLPKATHFPVLLLLFLLFCLLSIRLSPWAEEFWNKCDYKSFVLDEIAGYLLVPVLYRAPASWQSVLAGFILFRIFDIIKIFPANIVDRRMKNKWGVLLDDLVSSVYAAAILYLVF